ncbi:MAG: YcgN family cysteine cluster protein [Hasllibacter sp.]
MRERFWERHALGDLTREEWEALCDGCGKCCLNKLEDAETGEVHLTRVACRLFDGETCHCMDYANRKRHVPECIVLTPRTLGRHAYWLPRTCAYKRLHEGRRLPDWHPLVTGDPGTVHRAGVSARGWTVPETEVDEDDWDEMLVEEPT